MAIHARVIVSLIFCTALAGLSVEAQAGTVPAPVQLHAIAVAGKTTEVLTGDNGHTLYYFTHDTQGVATCSGSCADLWPPLLSKDPVARHVKGIPGTFATLKGPNGLQVDYNGHPLYFYAPDRKAGEALGNGLFGGTWWVATPHLAPVPIASAASAKAAPETHGW